MPADLPQSFSFTEADEPGGTLRLLLRGELDMTGVEPLRRRLEQARREGRAVLLDLEGLRFVDSAGIMLFVNASADARQDGWSVAFTAPDGEVERVLRLTGLTELLTFRGGRPHP
jgi:anti-sigma B factor antagonist